MSRPRSGPRARRRILPALGAILLAAGCGPRFSATGSRSGGGMDHVTAIYAQGRHAAVVTEGGTYGLDVLEAPPSPAARPRLRLRGRAPALPRASPETVRLGGCEYLPSELGIVKRCGDLSRVVPVGGFPVTSVAAYRGSVFAGTAGGGLRLADLPVLAIPGLPELVTALAPAGAYLLCGTDRGLYLLDGSKGERLEVYGPVDGRLLAEAAPTRRPKLSRCRAFFEGRARVCQG